MFRSATLADLPAIIALLVDDRLGQGREDAADPPNPAYLAAFSAIAADANQSLAVVEDEGRVIGCLQLSFIPGLSRLGMWRGQIESVRITADRRGGMSRAGLRAGAADNRQAKARGASLLRKPRFCREP
jgi:N-acetylglutamate synthase-like GNAT family acetyltransferase